MNPRVLSILLLISSFPYLLGSCGYRVLSSKEAPLEYSTLHVAAVQNLSAEPGLEDILRTSLVEELSLDPRIRIVASDAAEAILKSTVRHFSLIPSVESGGVAVQYEIRMQADFKVVWKESGDLLREAKNVESSVRAAFSVGSDPLGGRALQERAERLAAQSLAREAANRLLFP